MQQKISALTVGAVAIAVLAGGLVACGGDDTKESAAGNTKAVEEAFLTGMTHHHGTAVEMAEIAKKKGQTPFVRELANDIISTQERELGQMREIYERLIGGELEPDPGAHDGLGLSASEAGMTHSPETNDTLRTASPFDQAFVDEMEPHHTGAVQMAEVVLESTDDAELRGLAEGIIATQKREIEGMNEFRTKEYGAPVPENDGAGDEHEGEHSG